MVIRNFSHQLTASLTARTSQIPSKQDCLFFLICPSLSENTRIAKKKLKIQKIRKHLLYVLLTWHFRGHHLIVKITLAFLGKC